MKLERDVANWMQRRRRLIHQRGRHFISWKACKDCNVAGTVVRGTNAEQFATGGQFHCERCGGNDLRLATALEEKRALRWMDRNESKATKIRRKKIFALRAAKIRRMEAKQKTDSQIRKMKSLNQTSRKMKETHK